MKKFIISEEEKSRILNLHEGFKKGVITEQFTKVEGPYKNVAGIAITGDLYIMRLEKSMCRHQSRQFTLTPMTGTTCGEEYITIPGGKFYVQTNVGGEIRMLTSDHKQYVSATNNGQGYNTLEDAKKGVSLVLNPQGLTGRQVEKGTAQDGTKYKQVTKYNQQGDVQKSKLKMTTAAGNKTVEKGKSGL